MAGLSANSGIALGILTVVILVGLAALAGYAISGAADLLAHGYVLILIVATSALAQRSLYDHVHPC